MKRNGKKVLALALATITISSQIAFAGTSEFYEAYETLVESFSDSYLARERGFGFTDEQLVEKMGSAIDPTSPAGQQTVAVSRFLRPFLVCVAPFWKIARTGDWGHWGDGGYKDDGYGTKLVSWEDLNNLLPFAYQLPQQLQLLFKPAIHLSTAMLALYDNFGRRLGRLPQNVARVSKWVAAASALAQYLLCVSTTYHATPGEARKVITQLENWKRANVSVAAVTAKQYEQLHCILWDLLSCLRNMPMFLPSGQAVLRATPETRAAAGACVAQEENARARDGGYSYFAASAARRASRRQAEGHSIQRSSLLQVADEQARRLARLQAYLKQSITDSDAKAIEADRKQALEEREWHLLVARSLGWAVQ
ncbi:MAG: hypothetical protein LBJ38_01340 [Oscillospiraceae bacterium]|jgi:hypothetical protein|nr:hypothetical protein [Oscillospiraceae bacterium]